MNTIINYVNLLLIININFLNNKIHLFKKLFVLLYNETKKYII